MASTNTITIDGSRGEGGGQILRSSLSLAAILRRDLRIINIRSRRSNPGLGQQHCVCAQAAAALIPGATLQGCEVGSKELAIYFQPACVDGTWAAHPTVINNNSSKAHDFDIGSAGSAMLVFQTILPIGLFANLLSSNEQQHQQQQGTVLHPLRFKVRGGTHNGLSPSADFISKVFLPALAKHVGVDVKFTCERVGFYPAGGGRISAEVSPVSLPAQQQQKQAEEQVQKKSTAASNVAVCQLPANAKLLEWKVCLLLTRLAEQGNKNNLGAATVPPALDEIRQSMLPLAGAEVSAGGSGAAAAASSSGGKGRNNSNNKAAQQQQKQQQEAAAAAAAAAAQTLPAVVPVQPTIGSSEVHQSHGRGWCILQELTFGAGEEKATQVFTSMEKQLTPMIQCARQQVVEFLALEQQQQQSSSSSSSRLVFVDEYLCDQLILPLALVVFAEEKKNKAATKRRFEFVASTLSLHTVTNIAVVEQFLCRGIVSVFLGDAAIPVHEIVFGDQDPAKQLPPPGTRVRVVICMPEAK